MAIHDNVRPLYRDGLILGADELVDDQDYFRAALKRRSLARDMFGIAWGLDLALSGAAVRVSPGVAYGGDGNAIVVREAEDLSPDLVGKPASTQWAVYLELTETEDDGDPKLTFCNAPVDPRVAEGYRFTLEDVTGQGFASTRREGARIEPDAELNGALDGRQDRVLLGVVMIRSDGSFDVEQAGAALDPSVRPPLANAPDPGPAGAQYAGVTAEGIMHPRRWSKQAGSVGVLPAIQLDPDLGVHLREPFIAHEDVYVQRDGGATFRLDNDGAVLNLSHLAGSTDTKLVTFSSPPNPQVKVKADLAAEQKLNVTGASTFAGVVTMQSGLAVTTGNTEVQGLQVDLEAKFAQAVEVDAGLTVKGALTVGDPGSLPVGVLTTLNGDLDVKKGLTVAGATVLQQTLNVAGVTTLTSLNVTGATSFGPISPVTNLTVGSLTVSTHSQLNTSTGISGILGVSAAATFTGAATFDNRVITRADGSSGICIELTAGGAVTAGHVAALDASGNAVAASSATPTNVIGIFAATATTGNPVQVVVAGVALASILTTVASIAPGGLLIVGAGGVLITLAAPAPGTLVGKALQQVPMGGTFSRPILVTLG